MNQLANIMQVMSIVKKSIDGYILLTGGTKIQYRKCYLGKMVMDLLDGRVKSKRMHLPTIMVKDLSRTYKSNFNVTSKCQATIPTNAATRVRTERR